MRILVLEDRGAVAHGLVQALQAKGHSVSVAAWVYDAISYWNDQRPDCIIVDLNLVPNGLKPEEFAETEGGLLTGWVWLIHYVFPKGATIKARTLIYTRYVGEFEAKVSSQKRAGVAVISKSDERAASQVLGFVRKVESNLAGADNEAH